MPLTLGSAALGSATLADAPRSFLHTGWVEKRLPPFFTEITFLDVALWQWIGLALALLVAWFFGAVLGKVTLRLGARLARRTQATWDDLLLSELEGPLRALVTLLVLGPLIAALRLDPDVRDIVSLLFRTVFICSVAWLFFRVIAFTTETVCNAVSREGRDPAHIRASRTRLTLLRRFAEILVVLIATALVLLQFDVIRQVGVSLLASAGIAGVALGFAAQRSIAALLAGLQISVSQPIRIGDSVVVEGEFGTVEEISLTYVVVKVWDLRRIVLPMTYFLEKPFQNWTKASTELLGAVMLHADYAVPVPRLREELQRLCKDDPAWDGRAATLVVFEALERTVQLRAVVSAPDASKLFDLRARVREGMVAYLQTLDGGRYLPQARLNQLDAEPREGVPRTSDAAEKHQVSGVDLS